MVRTIYLDAGVILAYLKQEPNRVDVVEAALISAMSDTPKLKFFTCSLSLTEVAYVEGLEQPLEQGFKVIDDFWATAPVEIVEVNQVNALRGRQLLRDRALSNPNPEIASPK